MNNITIITVQFPNNSKQYYYLCDLDVKHGDYVVVDTSNGPICARVASTEVPRSVEPHKWVISIVPMERDYLKHQQYSIQQEKNQLVLQMRKQMETHDEIGVYQMLSSDDHRMKSLLNQYDSCCEKERAIRFDLQHNGYDVD